jgi:CheW-like domain
MNKSNPLVVFSLDEQRYALFLPVVERVLRIVAISPLPKAPEIVLGVLNVQGRIIPIIYLREWFSLPQREICLSDQLIIARTSRQTVAILVDSARVPCPPPHGGTVRTARLNATPSVNDPIILTDFCYSSLPSQHVLTWVGGFASHKKDCGPQLGLRGDTQKRA